MFLSYTISLLIFATLNTLIFLLNRIISGKARITIFAILSLDLLLFSYISVAHDWAFFETYTSFSLTALSVSALLSLRLCKFIFVNSTFTKNVLCQIDNDICEKVYVFYPPIPIRPMDKSELIKNISNRKNIVLTISRFSREKKIEIVMDIAKEVNEGEFIIVGSLVDNEYYMYLKRIIEKERIHNIKLQPNISFEELHSLRAKSKVYLHPMPYEHFGISIVEAMASGCVPVVHRSGGPWYDILERKEIYGYAYSTVNEAIVKIQALLSDPDHYLKKALLALERSKTFTYEKFCERLREFLYKIYL